MSVGPASARPFQFLANEYPEVAKHLKHKDAITCIHAIYKIKRMNPNKTGRALFHFFQKLIARNDALSNPPVRKLVDAAWLVLDGKPHADGIDGQVEGALNHYRFLVKGDAQHAVRREAAEKARVANTTNAVQEVAKGVHELLPETFVKNGIDLLVGGYVEIDPKVRQDIETDLRNAGGVISDAMRAKYTALLGKEFGNLVLSLDLHDIDLLVIPWSVDRKIEEIVTTFPHLKELNVAGCRLDYMDEEVIGSRLRELEELNISNIDRALFNSFKLDDHPFANLRVLKCNDSQAFDHELRHMPVFPRLERFSFQRSYCDEKSFLKRLNRAMPNLTHLDMSGSLDLKKKMFRKLHRLLPKLQQLNLQFCPKITQKDVTKLRAKFPHVEIIV